MRKIDFLFLSVYGRYLAGAAPGLVVGGGGGGVDHGRRLDVLALHALVDHAQLALRHASIPA
jgi:hypothetical protein